MVNATRDLEKATEQEYFDQAADERERKRRLTPEIPGVAVNKGAAQRSYRYSEARLEGMADPTDRVAFGRLDMADEQTYYIGDELIRGSAEEPLVISWKAPVAAPYYKASIAEPFEVSRKRTYQCDGNTIRDFSDVQLASVAGDQQSVDSALGRPEINDALLAELNAARTGELRNIVATIQAAQYEVIEAPLRQLTVIQGGPGTGKTAIALHRVSWLLYNHGQELTADAVLVVGPNKTFVRYIGGLLPGFGDRVAHRSVDDLRPGARVPLRVRGDEADEVAALKGDVRMAKLLARALGLGLKLPAPGQPWIVRLKKQTYELDGAEIAAAAKEAWEAGGTYNQRRMRLRNWFENRALVKEAAAERWPKPASAASMTDRIISPASPVSLVQWVLSAGERLRPIAGDLFTEMEVRLLHREPQLSDQERWTTADMPLLDEAEAIINGMPLRYQHVVVDEVQDLSPMQLRAVARRSNGSMTVVGDIAQSTGLWARDDWDDLLRHLPDQLPVVRHALRYGYRVPRQVHELAAQRTPDVAPGIDPPQPVRDASEDPRLWKVSGKDTAAHAAAQVRRHLDDGMSVGVICPPVRRQAIEGALIASNVGWSDADRGELGLPVTVVSPHKAKGLEFDAVVVVDPESILSSGARGDRLLYIALTRTTQRLDVVDVRHALELSHEPMPDVIPLVAGQSVSVEEVLPVLASSTINSDTADLQQRVVDLITDDLLERITATAPKHLWTAVIQTTMTKLAHYEREMDARSDA